MGQSQSNNDLALPQQQVVGGGSQQPTGSQQRRPPVRVAEQTDASTQVKMKFVWDKASLVFARVGENRAGMWELSAKFRADEACRFVGSFSCNERLVGGVAEFATPGHLGSGPPAIGAQFSVGNHTVVVPIDLRTYPLERFWKYKHDGHGVVPIVLELRAGGAPGQSMQQSVLHVALVGTPGGYTPTILKQKAVVGGQEYTLQEVYGLAELGKEDKHDESAMGEPCVICLTEPRNTALLPCMHLCVCEECAGQLLANAAMQGMKCPICRGGIGNIRAFNVGKS